MTARRLVIDLPTRLSLLVLWTLVVSSVAVLLGRFTPAFVLPALLVVLLVTRRWVPEPVPVSRQALVGAGSALALAGAWVAVNLRLTSEVLLVQRDPGFLTLQGLWLAEHSQATVPVRTAAEVAAQVPGVALGAEAFWTDGQGLFAQGEKGFPALIGLGGWLAGQRGVLSAGLVIGGVALLALYDLARRVVGPRLGLLPMAALALTLPMLYFSRTPFTEPTTMVLGLSAVTMAWSAVATRQTGRAAMAGALAGGCALARIDGAAIVAGLVLGLGAVAIGTRDPGRRARCRRSLWAALAPAVGMVMLGHLDLRRTSPAYLAAHRGLYLQLIALVVGCVLVVVVLERATRGGRLAGWLARNRRVLGSVGVGVVVAVAVVLASRPLWMTAHWFDAGSSYARFIAAFQRTAGVPIDGTRSYDEMTITWLAWYLGPVTVVLAVLGAALVVREAVVARDPRLVLLLAMLGVPTLVYVVRPAITPDQVWAMRRLLPVAMPAVLLCATWAIRHLRGSTPRLARRIGSAVLAAAVLASPLVRWGPLVGSVEYGGRADDVAGMCQRAQGGRVVVARGAPTLLPTLRIACDADVVEVDTPTPGQLAAIRRAWGDQPVVLMTYAPATVPWTRHPQPTTVTRLSRWPHTLYPTAYPVVFDSALWMGTVTPDGRVEPIDPDR